MVGEPDPPVEGSSYGTLAGASDWYRPLNARIRCRTRPGIKPLRQRRTTRGMHVACLSSRDLAMRYWVGATIMIRKLKTGKYRLYSKKVDSKTGKRKNLGTFDTREAAEEHERAVQYFKHQH